MQYHPSDALGGAELQASFIAKLLAERGDHPTYVSTDSASESGDRSTEPADSRSTVIRIAARAKEVSMPFAIEKVLRTIDPDVCYVRSFPLMHDVLTICRRLGIPSIAHFASDGEARPHPRIVGPRQLTPRYLRWHSRQRRAALSIADAVVCQTQHQLGLVGRRASRAGQLRLVVPNMWPEAEVAAEEGRTIAWVGNLKRAKRPQAFVDLASRLRERGYRFEMIGSPAPRYATLLAKAMEIPEFVFRGHLDVDATSRRIAAASVLVNTSWFEGFPNTYLQAFAAGRPVLSLGADPDGILASHGIGVKCGSRRQLASRAAALLDDPETRAAYGARALAYFTAHHSIGVARARYYALFDSVVSGREE